MNEPIMRRGLSPEGRVIRERHQSNLFNGEAGVTSHIHKKLENNFLRDNVPHLKEIQAKCRSTDRASSRNLPMKAFPCDDIHIPQQIKSTINDGNSMRERLNSAHSDYFSLSNDSRISNGAHVSSPVDGHCRLSTQSLTDACNDSQLPGSINDKSGGVGMSIYPGNKPRSTKSSSRSFKPLNLLEKGTRSVAPHSEVESVLPERICSSRYSQARVSSPSSNVKILIEKIKGQKAACETNSTNIWKGLEKQHKSLCFYDESFSQYSESYNEHQKDVSNTTLNMPQRSDPIRLERCSNHLRSLSNRTYVDKGTQSIISKQPSMSDEYLDSSLKDKVSQTSESHFETSLHPQLSSNIDYNYDAPKDPLENVERDWGKLAVESAKSSTCQDLRASGLKEKCSTPSSVVEESDRRQRDESCESLSNESDGERESRTQNHLYKPLIRACQKPFILNKEKFAKKESMPRSKSSPDVRKKDLLPPSYRKGQIPRYLAARKAEEQRKIEIAAAVDPHCPPGHTPLPDHERRNTLHLLKKGMADNMSKLSSLPVAQNTLRVQKVRKDVESKLKQIEEGIQIFSQPKVYVINDE